MLAPLLKSQGLMLDCMLIAVPVSNNVVSGPGEAEEILILDSEKGYSIAERFANPALEPGASPGIRMIRSIIERKVSVLLVGHIGMHAFSYARNRLSIYPCTGMRWEDAVNAYRSGMLRELENPLPGDHQHQN